LADDDYNDVEAGNDDDYNDVEVRGTVANNGVARNLVRGRGAGKMEKSCDVSLVTFFGDVITMTLIKLVITDFFKVSFRHNQFVKPQFGEITELPFHQN